MKYFKIIYNSLLWAMIISITAFKSEWLEMRVNIGYILFATFIALSFIFSIYFRKKEFQFDFKFTIINFVICTVYSTLLYGFKRLQIVPASIIREGLDMTRVPFSTINIISIIILIMGLGLILLSDKKQGNKVNKNLFAK